MTLRNQCIKKLFFEKRLELLSQKKARYIQLQSSEEKYAYQLAQFNTQWKVLSQSHPFYSKWAKEHQLPSQITALQELRKFPILNKAIIRENYDLIFSHLEKYYTLSTGGSTGVPVKFPSSKQEKDEEYATVYLGRSWSDIEPMDSIAHIWGHSHLFGTGIKGKINEIKRKISDRLINTSRLDAYNMSPSNLHDYYQKICLQKPAAIIGYTSTLYKLAKYMDENALRYNHAGLKAVIVTSETITKNDYDLIEKVFSVPAVSEYGMVEAGLISYSKGWDRQHHVFWDQIIAQSDVNGQLYISTLYNKDFPLINYDTTDSVQPANQYLTSIESFSEIKGRAIDVLLVNAQNLANPLSLSGILMIHILKGYPHLYSIQFKQLENNLVKIMLVSPIQLDLNKLKDFFLSTLLNDYPTADPSAFFFEQVSTSVKTIAGKEGLILR